MSMSMSMYCICVESAKKANEYGEKKDWNGDLKKTYKGCWDTKPTINKSKKKVGRESIDGCDYGMVFLVNAKCEGACKM